LSVSIGIAVTGLGGLDLSRLLSLADAALYQAKREGRDKVVLSELQVPVQPEEFADAEPCRRFR
jgi:predicted signal transduction protein with EAL and GGDEF domain